MSVRWLAGALLVGALAAGCSTMKIGREFDYEAFGSRVRTGETDAAQVREWLGPPVGTGVEVLPDGTRLEVWTYYAGRGRIPSGSDVSFKMLQVKLTAAGKVTGYVWTGDLSGAAVEDKSKK